MNKKFLLINANSILRSTVTNESETGFRVIGKENATNTFEENNVLSANRFIILELKSRSLEKQKYYYEIVKGFDIFTNKEFQIYFTNGVAVRGNSKSLFIPEYIEFYGGSNIISFEEVKQFYAQLVASGNIENYLTALTSFYRTNSRKVNKNHKKL